MTKYNFKNDYSEGAHERILKALGDSNLIQEEGYGEDAYCNEAVKLIREKYKIPKLIFISFLGEHKQTSL